MWNRRSTCLVALTFAAAATRLLPHLPNLTPIGAMALFGGAKFPSRRAAFAVTLGAMFLSDVALGLTRYGADIFPAMPFVYTAFSLTVILGRRIRRQGSAGAVGAAAVASSILFFALTNFGVWWQGHLYPKTIEGLSACYAAAIPFFRNTLLGNLLYSSLLFGGFALAKRHVVSLRLDSALDAPRA